MKASPKHFSIIIRCIRTSFEMVPLYTLVSFLTAVLIAFVPFARNWVLGDLVDSFNVGSDLSYVTALAVLLAGAYFVGAALDIARSYFSRLLFTVSEIKTHIKQAQTISSKELIFK